MSRKRFTPPVDPLEQRLERVESALLELQGRVLAMLEREGELQKVRELALEAVAQAQDALATSKSVSAYDARLNQLTLAVAEGIQHVERAENRIRATVQRARQELRDADLLEHPGLEAEARELRLVDGARGEERRVQPVREEVEDDSEMVALPGIPGRVSRGQLKQLGRM